MVCIRNWMYPIITNSGNNVGWLLTPYSVDASSAWSVTSSGGVGYSHVYDDSDYVYNASSGVSPVLFLDSNLSIVEGTTGSEDNPFKLEG